MMSNGIFRKPAKIPDAAIVRGLVRLLIRGLPIHRAMIASAASLLIAPSHVSAQPRFEGKALVAVSDGDMLPSAYIDGGLGPAAPDALTVVPLDQPGPLAVAGRIAVSNSVAGPPASVAVSPDGHYAVVIETRGQRPPGRSAQVIGDLPPGDRMMVVDISDPERPRVVQTISTPKVPEAVTFSPDGRLLVVTFQGRRGTPPILFYRFESGRASPALAATVPGWEDGDTLIDADFHPELPIMALLNSTRSRLSLVGFRMGSADQVILSALGDPIAVEMSPFLVRFTPDGRHVLVNSGYAAYGYNLNDNAQPRGTVASFRVDAGAEPGAKANLRLVSRATTGVIPEGMAISPDGAWVATANLERSVAAPTDPDMRRFSSISLLRLDPATGLLDRAAEVAIDGALPETVVFDNSSRFIAVTVFSQFDAPTADGEIGFFRIEQDPYERQRVELVKTNTSVTVPRGAHSMVIVR